jgi:hypothetical protein
MNRITTVNTREAKIPHSSGGVCLRVQTLERELRWQPPACLRRVELSSKLAEPPFEQFQIHRTRFEGRKLPAYVQ